MKKRFNSSFLLATLLVIFLLISLTGCGLWSTPLKSISFGDLTELTIAVGEEYQLAPTIKPSTAGSSVRYYSSNKSVATVSESGLLKGISGGDTVVKAENVLGTIGSEIKVSVVYQKIPAGGLVLSAENAQQYYGSDIESVDFTLDWGQVHVPSNAKIEWLQKEKGSSKFTPLSAAAGKKTFSLTPTDEMGYFATVQVKVTYDGATYTSNDITYGVYDAMRDVGISYAVSDTGLDVSGVMYTAYLGEEFTLTLSWNDNSNQTPEIKWYIQKEGDTTKQIIGGQTSSTLKYAITPTGAETAINKIGDFTITASADGVETDSYSSFYLSTDYANVKNATLAADGHSGDIVITTLDTQDLIFTAGWNSKCTDNANVVIEYYSAPALAGGETIYNFTLQHTISASATDIKYTYTPTMIAGDYAVKAIVYNSLGSAIKSEAIALISVIERYNAVDDIALEVASGTLEQTSGIYNDVVFSASPTPSNGLNSTLLYEWYIDGEKQDEITGSTLTLSGSYLASNLGETAVTVKFGGVESKLLTALAFPNISSNGEYLNQKFIWNGNEYNHYISSMDEFIIAVCYIEMTRKANLRFCFDSNSDSGVAFSSSEELTGKVQVAIKQGIDEGGSNGIEYQFEQANRAKISCKSDAPLTSSATFDNTSPYYNPDKDITTEQKKGKLHYSQESGRTTLPIDSATETYNITTSNMLYRVVSWGYKPTFNEVDGETPEQTTARQNAQTIYNNARTVALSICDDNMSEFEKALAIYEWVVVAVDYDYALEGAGGTPTDEIPNPTPNQSMMYDGFYLEGIFLKGAGEKRKAVCDGKSKAFTLLCALEGIESVRVIGYVDGNPLMGHAWNKVLLDTDYDGIKHWYAVDTTWGDQRKDGTTYEYLKYSYFLLSDSEISVTHTENRNYYPKAEDVGYNFFKTLSHTVDEDMLDGERYILPFVKEPSEISNTTVAFVETVEQLAVILAVAQLYSYAEFVITIDFISAFADAKIMLADESDTWGYAVEPNHYIVFYTA